ncbi:hypothetical protein C0Q70_09496 [Pomacea canaliculata]|uniref:Dephospho-CoA kinase domain-containing protein n=1 Tax=Pomacea canaliculata TaxID=400727 RepID=A0A2T7P9Y5_POMCA|nr:dephospho-CoA kinase domain-containing protein-like [Pomacea canaliculata]PVD30234.1 hypothetical protein C0Q70_09496 [Pomacea canaliculata]
MFLVGLTGGIATGKSTASNMFRRLGAYVIEADQVSRDVVKPGLPAWCKIREEFGGDVFLEDGQLNREEMGRIIFSDSTRRKQLNAITHPEIRKAILWQLLICFLKGYQFVILDIPLLFETRSMLSLLSFIIVISCTERQQLQRLMARNGFSKEEAESRIKSQMPLTEKCRMANYVVDNSGTEEMTEKQIVDLFRKFNRSKLHWPIRILGWTVIAFFVWIIAKLVNLFL